MRPSEMAVLPRSEWLTAAVGSSKELGGKCYFVLTPSHFGWKATTAPVNLPFFFPSRFEALLVSDIANVHVDCLDLWRYYCLNMHIKGRQEPLGVVVTFPHIWVTGFERCGVPVTGLDVRANSLRGMLRNYGWFLWLFLLFGACLAVMALSPSNVFAQNLTICFACLALANVVAILLSKRLRNWA